VCRKAGTSAGVIVRVAAWIGEAVNPPATAAATTPHPFRKDTDGTQYRRARRGDQYQNRTDPRWLILVCAAQLRNWVIGEVDSR